MIHWLDENQFCEKALSSRPKLMKFIGDIIHQLGSICPNLFNQSLKHGCAFQLLGHITYTQMYQC